MGSARASHAVFGALAEHDLPSEKLDCRKVRDCGGAIARTRGAYAPQMSTLTTHVLDTMRGCPARDMTIELHVAAEVHRTHSAATQLALDGIAALQSAAQTLERVAR